MSGSLRLQWRRVRGGIGEQPEWRDSSLVDSDVYSEKNEREVLNPSNDYRIVGKVKAGSRKC